MAISQASVYNLSDGTISALKTLLYRWFKLALKFLRLRRKLLAKFKNKLLPLKPQK
jgi:hypothetical protein